MKIFVYGSLMEGMIHHSMLQDAKFIGEAAVCGYNMYSINDYFPAAVEGTGVIKGEVYEASTLTMMATDALEGYIEGMDETSFFVRKKVNTDLGECFMYIKSQAPKGVKLIGESWKEYKENLDANI